MPSSAHSLLQSVLSPSSPATAPPSRTHTPLSAPSSTTLSISTPQQFYDWFTTLTSALSSEQDALYRDHLAEVAGYRAACDRLVGACERAEGVCDDMRDAFAFVEQRSESLQAACEHLLEEQVRPYLTLRSIYRALRVELCGMAGCRIQPGGRRC